MSLVGDPLVEFDESLANFARYFESEESLDETWDVGPACPGFMQSFDTLIDEARAGARAVIDRAANAVRGTKRSFGAILSGRVVAAGGGDERKDSAQSAARTQAFSDVMAEFPGTKRLARLKTRLETIITRSSDQVRFHNAMVTMCLPTIFRENWSQYGMGIVRELSSDFDGDTMGIIISTPRRFGKTTAVAAFCAAMMLECKDLKMVVFATVERQSNMLADLMWSMMEKHVRIKPEVHNREELVLPAHGGRNMVRCVPSSAKGARGTGGEVIIAEEFGFMDPKFFREVIIPILAVAGSRIIAISSPSDKAINHMSSAMDAVDPGNGKPLFKSIIVSRMCKKCAAMKDSNCAHVVPTNPPWRQSGRQNTLMSLYANASLEGQRELLGATVTSDTPAFDHVMLAAVFHDKGRLYSFDPAKGGRAPERIYIALDPSAGGTASDSAVVSFFFPEVRGACAQKLVVSRRLCVYCRDGRF